jgi:hypothetical protein
MIGSCNRNHPDAPDLQDLQTGGVHMDETSDADPAIVVAHDPFDSLDRLHREPKGYSGKFRVKIIEHRHQFVARIRLQPRSVL